jgi:hypothetical protein
MLSKEAAIVRKYLSILKNYEQAFRRGDTFFTIHFMQKASPE